MPRHWWALTQHELPRPNGGLSKHIKYCILCLAYARSGGDALTGGTCKHPGSRPVMLKNLPDHLLFTHQNYLGSKPLVHPNLEHCVFVRPYNNHNISGYKSNHFIGSVCRTKTMQRLLCSKRQNS